MKPWIFSKPPHTLFQRMMYHYIPEIEYRDHKCTIFEAGGHLLQRPHEFGYLEEKTTLFSKNMVKNSVRSKDQGVGLSRLIITKLLQSGYIRLDVNNLR